MSEENEYNIDEEEENNEKMDYSENEQEDDLNEQLELLFQNAKLNNDISEFQNVISLEIENSKERKWTFLSYEEICKIAIKKKDFSLFSKNFEKLSENFTKVDSIYNGETIETFKNILSKSNNEMQINEIKKYYEEMLRLSDKFKLENLSFQISSHLLSIEYENKSNNNVNNINSNKKNDLIDQICLNFNLMIKFFYALIFQQKYSDCSIINETEILLIKKNIENSQITIKDFEKVCKIPNLVSIIEKSIKNFHTTSVREFWLQWLEDFNTFNKLPRFFVILMNHKKCFEIFFKLLVGRYDNKNSIGTVGIEASKYIYDILDLSLIEIKKWELRKVLIDTGIYEILLNRLEDLTKESPRKFSPGKEIENINNNNNNNLNTKKTISKGIGYGTRTTWDVEFYLEAKKIKSIRQSCIIKILGDFYDTEFIDLSNGIKNLILESVILPCIESAFRGGSINEIAKNYELYFEYLNLVRKFSNHKELVPFLLDISKDYKPVQINSIFHLLKNLKNVANTYKSLIDKEKDNVNKNSFDKNKINNNFNEFYIKFGIVGNFNYNKNNNTVPEFNNIEEINKMAKIKLNLCDEIINTYQIVNENINKYSSINTTNKFNIEDILKLPVEKSYPILLKNQIFDYIDLKNDHKFGKLNTGSPSQEKLLKLAEDYVDLQSNLPVESSNSIFVRVDKNNMDFMKVLIFGSDGTPYSNGAFIFDVFFDNNYPNLPPKVLIVTTGKGTVRFNPNLYSNGKVCLSLLGTWSGVSTENWDKKVSTLNQIFISIQSIIMSEYVLFNEPGYENQMNSTKGEQDNEGYSNIIRYNNIKWAMIEQIKNPPKGFENVILTHFFLKKDKILKEVNEWIERSNKFTANYDGLVNSHNFNYASQFKINGEYNKQLKNIYHELVNVLNNIKLPNLKIIYEENITNSFSNENNNVNNNNINNNNVNNNNNITIKSENLNSIDMSYDNDGTKKTKDKSMNLNSEEVKDRWSRYIGVVGMDALEKQMNSSVFISGMNGLGIEIAKNIILCGCKELTLHDIKHCSYYDLANQFYLDEKDLGKNRALSSYKKLRELNYYVKVECNVNVFNLNEDDLKNKFNLNKFNVVIITECDNIDIIKFIDNFCRKNKIYFIYANIYGMFGRIINDFGDNFVVLDKDGEEPKSNLIKNMNKIDNNNVIIELVNKNDFESGDIIKINDVIGFDGINENVYKIKKIINKNNISICGDFSKINNNYNQNGFCIEIKQNKNINFKPISNILDLNIENYLNVNDYMIENNFYDYSKMNNSPLINLGMNCVDKYIKIYGDTLIPWNINIQYEFLEILYNNNFDLNQKLKDYELDMILRMFYTKQIQFPPLCAYLGGIVAQECIKAITKKFTPINQLITYDTQELYLQFPIYSSNSVHSVITANKLNIIPSSALDSLMILFGINNVENLIKSNILCIGAGAIGCELIKNLSMLNIGTNGSIHVTDPDVIETSNLNRQFLFREKHCRLPKSTTACAAAQQMNKNLKDHIFAHTLKVCEETEILFNNKFFKKMNVVLNALDNVEARRYIDKRCVLNRVAMIDSGTLGTKGHVQVIIPFKTESYRSVNDADLNEDIPVCTLKMFPENNVHCIEWAKDKMLNKFSVFPKNFIKIVDDIKNYINNNNNEDFGLDNNIILKKILKSIKKIPNTFDDCLKISKEKYTKYFINDIKQLLYCYPLDKKDKDGKLFWSLPKRAPKIYEFDENDENCVNFIVSYAILLANMFKINIPFDNNKLRTNEVKNEMIKIIKNYKIKEFVPDEEKAKIIENEVENINKNKDENKNKNINENEFNKNNNQELINKIKSNFSFVSKLKLNSIEFNKDNNYQIDLITSMSNLRCINYSLQTLDWLSTKIKVGKIIPALSTTTSCVAALQTIELIKILFNFNNIEIFKNSFLNLSLPLIQFSEPGEIKKNLIKEGLFSTIWDIWEVNIKYNDNIENNINFLFKKLREKYKIEPKDIFKEKKIVYSYKMSKNNNLLRRKLNELLGFNLNNMNKDDNYVDVTITFMLNANSQEYLKNIPIVRIVFTS